LEKARKRVKRGNKVCVHVGHIPILKSGTRISSVVLYSDKATSRALKPSPISRAESLSQSESSSLSHRVIDRRTVVRYAVRPAIRFPFGVGLVQTAATQAKPRRGLICRHCGKQIRLSATFLKRERNIAIAPTVDPALYSRVLPARCRHCHREAIYAVDQIIDL